MSRTKLFLLLAFVVVLLAAIAVARYLHWPAATSTEGNVALLDGRLLPEASGMAMSNDNSQRLWLHNDSGNPAKLIAVDLPDAQHSVVNVIGADNNDWEDLAAFRSQGKSWLAIADVGDNFAQREPVYIYLLPEPMAGDTSVTVQITLQLTFTDGPRDVESMAVDAKTGTLYLLSKREFPPRLFSIELPDLAVAADYAVTPQDLGPVTTIPIASEEEKKRFPRYGKFRHQPTGMDLAQDSGLLTILTYRGAYITRLGDDRDWLQAINTGLCPVSTPELDQGESIAAGPEGTFYVVSEGSDAPIFSVPAQCSSTAD